MRSSVPSRYLIGIDLGTTNSVVAYIDTEAAPGADSGIRVFPIPQLVAHGEVRTLPALPSFLYFPTQDELSGGTVSATWDEDPPMVTGVLAREQGALVPSRQVSSAKSWLSYAGVDRRAKILPAQAASAGQSMQHAGGSPMISPVEASARYLMHLRDAWNADIGTRPEARFERQEIVLTVPASFDEEARELTVEAARRAGLENLTLLEEPLAAFYAWIAANREQPSPARDDDDLQDGELILICDIGGGTTDFSLIRARVINGELQFERTAIGEHLLLGGDNLDFALARRVEEKLSDFKFTLRQRYALRRVCCAAKERFLSDPSLERAPVTILGSGRAVVGQALSVELTREEVLQVLTAGFLPITAPDENPARGRTAGLRELGLPYASDPAITKHLSAFLRQAAATMNGAAAGRQLARPDAVLFNGGFCAPDVTRARIVEAISVWFRDDVGRGWHPKVLNNEAAESAVARGAAYYGRVRRGAGLRVRAGSARTYYIGLRSEDGPQGICVLPAGVDEGATLPPLNREFSVLANRPVSFTLYSSRMRHDAHGAIVPLEPDSMHRHAPLVTMLRYGKKLREAQLSVRLRARFTEIGTLELWCESQESAHYWRLQFELRGEETQREQAFAPQPRSARAAQAPASEAEVEAAAQLIRRVFGDSADSIAPDSLLGEMETALGTKRDSWPVPAIRRFCDVVIELAAGRTKSARHEVRWLNLAGFCLRPGFGAAGDHERIERLGALVLNTPVFTDDLPCQVETLVMLRRVSGGISASQQQMLFKKYERLVGLGGRPGKKRARVNRQLEHEAWRLMASLEHLPASTRGPLGNALLAQIRKNPDDAIRLWSLGRLGARVPLYGPLHSVVPAEVAGEWAEALLNLSVFTAATAFAIVMLARCTDDRSRDLDDGIRGQAASRLAALGIAGELAQLLSKYVPPERADAVRSFGESLPPGLQLTSSSSCLLSVPALHSSSPFFSKPA